MQTKRKEQEWSNPSVLALIKGSEEKDPLRQIKDLARQKVLYAIQKGWQGPPFDPFALAEKLGVTVVPKGDLADARTVPRPGKKLQIEFNPNRPRGRVRYSIAHELAHTLFPDCFEEVRNRISKSEISDDEWQLEMLCNVGAAEFLMPIGSFLGLRKELPDINKLMELRKEYEVSTEALLIRTTSITSHKCCMFCASRYESGPQDGRYKIDYTFPSKSFPFRINRGIILPNDSILSECTAIGWTAKGEEIWQEKLGKLKVECVGIPPYPGKVFPRVVGMISVRAQGKEVSSIRYLKGDASEPRGRKHRIIAHVVNDKTPNWGGFGFAKFLKKKWPHVQREFRDWAIENKGRLKLGNTYLSRLDEELSVFNMIAQHGYGKSAEPRIRYAALRSCFDQLSEQAIKLEASVHMPRVGCGEAGGSWSIVSELIEESICKRGVPVTIYDLP
jgi:Zn-dependent peptidase ImmA (M78 family)/O-acetyl-ADP-ribose deacetylase (regulator of RNase III)